MRITQNTIYQNISQNLSAITEQLNNVNEQIASGKRINQPSDDPIGITQALNLKTVLSQITQYGTNINQAQSWLQATDSALESVQGLINQATTLATQMSTGTYNASDRANAAQEVENILEQVVQIGNTQVDGRYIFSGDKDQTPAYSLNFTIGQPVAASTNSGTYTGTVTSSGTYTGLYSKSYVVQITTGGPVGVAQYKVSEDGGKTWGPADAFTTSTTPTAIYDSTNSLEPDPEQEGAQISFSNSGTLSVGDTFTFNVSQYNGDQGDMNLIIGPSAQLQTNVTGDTAFGQDGDTANNLLDTLAGLKNSLQNNDISGIGTALQQLGNAEVNNTNTLADVGSRLDRITADQGMLSNLQNNNTNALSGIEDTDITQATLQLNSDQTIFEAALYSATKVTGLSLLNYLT